MSFISFLSCLLKDVSFVSMQSINMSESLSSMFLKDINSERDENPVEFDMFKYKKIILFSIFIFLFKIKTNVNLIKKEVVAY